MYGTKVEFLSIKFNKDELIITVNFVDDDYKTATGQISNSRYIIYEVPSRKLAKVKTIKIVKNMCEDMYYS